MRPDLDDYEELNEGNAPRSRAMSWLVLVVAVGGFVALAYYAYHSGSQSMRDGQVLVVKADETPIKGEPASPGGAEFPNQDKTIYDAIGNENEAEGKSEKLLPEAEQPVIPQPAVGDEKKAEAAPAAPAAAARPEANTTTYVNNDLKGDSAPVDPVDAQSMKQPAPPVAPEAEAPKAAAPVAAAAPATPAPAPAPKAAAISNPTMVNVKPANAPAEKPAAKKVDKAATKPAAKTTSTAASTGTYQIQLGAFKSDAEARQQWAKISAKHSDVLKGSPVVVKADLPNGTFYRLRASGFASSDAAKAACAKLSAAGQACFPAGK